MVNLIYTVTVPISPSSTSYMVVSTTLPSPNSSSRNNGGGGSHVSITLLALVLVGVGLLVVAIGAWCRWAFLKKQGIQMEQRMLERAERDAARRARREKLESMVPPTLYEAELSGAEKTPAGWTSTDEEKLPLALTVPARLSSKSQSSTSPSPPNQDMLLLSVLILPPTPPPSSAMDDRSAPVLHDDYADNEQDVPEVVLGTTTVSLSHASDEDRRLWDELVRSMRTVKKARTVDPIAPAETPSGLA